MAVLKKNDLEKIGITTFLFSYFQLNKIPRYIRQQKLHCRTSVYTHRKKHADEDRDEVADDEKKMFEHRKKSSKKINFQAILAGKTFYARNLLLLIGWITVGVHHDRRYQTEGFGEKRV